MFFQASGIAKKKPPPYINCLGTHCTYLLVIWIGMTVFVCTVLAGSAEF